MSKTIETNRDWHTHWNNVHARAGKDELLRQVERTVAGQPVPPEQIALLLDAVADHLDLGLPDVLLDLCCGNGFLTARLAARCRFALGVDYSRDLIEIAREQHASPNTVYLHKAAEAIDSADFPVGRPNKVCINFSLQHFTRAMAANTLAAVSAVGDSDVMLLFTDVPDIDRIRAFYNTPERWADYERRQAAGTEAIGTWWDGDELLALLEAAGFEAELLYPAPRRQTSHYRFDVLARRAR